MAPTARPTEGALAPTSDPDEVRRRLAMPLDQAMRTQRAVRRVLPDPVDDAVLRPLFDLAIQAPTGSNGQNWEFVVVRDHDTKASLQAQYQRAWSLYGGVGRRIKRDEQTARILRSVQWQVEHFTEIPVVVVCCLSGVPALPLVPLPPVGRSSHYGSLYPAVQNLLLGARAVGLGGSLITLPLWSTTVARRLLGLPLNVEPCCVVPLGWARGRYGEKARTAAAEHVHLDRWGDRGWR